MDLSNIATDDIKAVRVFMEHFNFPVSDTLADAMDNYEKEETEENKETFIKELISLLVTNPECDLTSLDDIFKPVQEELEKAHEEFKGDL